MAAVMQSGDGIGLVLRRLAAISETFFAENSRYVMTEAEVRDLLVDTFAILANAASRRELEPLLDRMAAAAAEQRQQFARQVRALAPANLPAASRGHVQNVVELIRGCLDPPVP